jgi:hypothetical protein
MQTQQHAAPRAYRALGVYCGKVTTPRPVKGTPAFANVKRYQEAKRRYMTEHLRVIPGGKL